MSLSSSASVGANMHSFADYGEIQLNFVLYEKLHSEYSPQCSGVCNEVLFQYAVQAECRSALTGTPALNWDSIRDAFMQSPWVRTTYETLRMVQKTLWEGSL